MRAPRSLARQLLGWLLIPLVALLAVNAFLSYRAALEKADDAYDRLLAASVHAIADRVGVTDDEIAVDVPYVALDLFQSKTQERIFYRVATDAGHTVTGYDDLPLPPRGPAAADEVVFYRAPYRDETVYFAALRKPLYEGQRLGPVLVEVGETSEARDALSRAILYDSLVRQGVLIAVAALLVSLGLRRGLRPLLRLRDAIARRSPTDLSPIDENDVQSEVRPLIRAINQHTERLDKLLAARRRFLDDASHQLRSPLTALKTQAEYGLAQADSEPNRALLRDIHRTTDQTIRLVNQLLTLARADPQGVQKRDMGPVDLRSLARAATVELVPAARQKRIDLGFDSGDGDCTVIGNAVLLHELVANLVDNAIRYTQAGGTITVRADRQVLHVRLEVEDDGPGIPADERDLVFDRFYRGTTSSGHGSGLGLAIVRDICGSHDARIELSPGRDGKGLRVGVEFAGAAQSEAPPVAATSDSRSPRATA